MRQLDAIREAAEANFLEDFGTFTVEAGDHLPAGTKSVMLLGPREPGFWTHVKAEREFRDRVQDPLDTWSHRVISDLADTFGLTAIFPFIGPPYSPFFTFALRTNRAWVSPVQWLVHDRAGLMLSYRGGLCFPEALEGTAQQASPCESCTTKPCLTACPVNAFEGGEYDISACRTYLTENTGAECMSAGCRARVLCPISQTYAREPRQSAYHMRKFME